MRVWPYRPQTLVVNNSVVVSTTTQPDSTVKVHGKVHFAAGEGWCCCTSVTPKFAYQYSMEYYLTN